MKDIQPDMKNGIGICCDTCPSHDGKRCKLLGFRAPEGHVCEPWAVALTDACKMMAENENAILRSNPPASVMDHFLSGWQSMKELIDPES